MVSCTITNYGFYNIPHNLLIAALQLPRDNLFYYSKLLKKVIIAFTKKKRYSRRFIEKTLPARAERIGLKDFSAYTRNTPEEVLGSLTIYKLLDEEPTSQDDDWDPSKFGG